MEEDDPYGVSPMSSRQPARPAASQLAHAPARSPAPPVAYAAAPRAPLPRLPAPRVAAALPPEDFAAEPLSLAAPGPDDPIY